VRRLGHGRPLYRGERSLISRASSAKSKGFLRNGDAGRWVYGLEHKAEGLRSPMQIVNHPRAVSGLIGRRTRVYIFHPVLHGIVEQHCDLARRGGHCLGLADARREPSVEGAQCGVGSSHGCGSKP
jgi:hypothetical protein